MQQQWYHRPLRPPCSRAPMLCASTTSGGLPGPAKRSRSRATWGQRGRRHADRIAGELRGKCPSGPSQAVRHLLASGSKAAGWWHASRHMQSTTKGKASSQRAHFVLDLLFKRKHAAARRQPLAVLQRRSFLQGESGHHQRARGVPALLQALAVHGCGSLPLEHTAQELRHRPTHHAQVADARDPRPPAQLAVQRAHEGGVVRRRARVARNDEQLHPRWACG